jgi:hypothetical protein
MLALASMPSRLNAQSCGTGTNCRFVDPYATGIPINGQSWNTAYRDVQAALVAEPPGRTFWVRAETYFPGGSFAGTVRSDQFAIEAGDVLLGGFEGDETVGSKTSAPLAVERPKWQ